MLSGDNGLLKRAGDARDETIVGQEKEQVELAYVSAAVKKLGEDVDETDLQTELNNSVGSGKTTVSPNGDDTLNVNFTDTKHNYTVDSGTVTRTADGEVEVVPTGKVARIGTTYYESLQDAFDDVSANNTRKEVILLANVSENVLVKENQNIVLNLNNKTVTNVEGTADAGDWNQAAIEVRNMGVIEIANGTIEAEFGNVLENYGTTTINGGTFSAVAESFNQVNIFTLGGTLNINGGIFRSNSDNVVSIWDSANVYITGGTFTTNNNDCIFCDHSYLKIEGGSFTTAHGNAVCLQTGSADIYDGTFVGGDGFEDLEAINYWSNPMNVYGGTFTTSQGITDLRESSQPQ